MADDNSDLSLAVGEVRAGIRHLLSTMDQLRDGMKEMKVEFNRETGELSKRITAVEKFMWRAAGMAAVASMLIPIGVTVLLRWLGG